MIKRNRSYAGHRILVADDEPYYLEWLSDYLESLGVGVDYASNVDESIEKLRSFDYRIIVVDLNIPLLKEAEHYAVAKTDAYSSYPGLYIANVARNSGYRSRQVIIYSVFTSREIQDAASRINCTYLTKGHPVDLKREVDEVLSYDPTIGNG